ncbi:hypothetical protein AB4097_02135 [Microvirga sp. 2MCAF35]|uniref:DUF6894 family protein n=1 Tax=Microvirga sp. 2MCAF35 TaxID=3232987 RepID=UPI003F948466
MPRFYFDVREDGTVSTDQLGVECADLDAAEHEAAKGAADIAREKLQKGDAHEVVVEVRDERGFLMSTTTVSLVVRRTVRALV